MSSEPRHTPRRAALAAALAALLLPAAASAQEDAPLRLGLKVGVESDSNARREEGAATEDDLLTRFFLILDADHSQGPGQELSARLRSGGKLYRNTQRETALLNQADLRYTLRPLLAWDAPWLFLYASGNVKDRTEQERFRDYLQLGVSAGAGASLGPVVLSAGGSLRRFIFKPDPDQSSDGPGAEASLRWSITDTWIAQLAWSYQVRAFDALRFVQQDSGEVVRDEEGRVFRGDETWGWSAGLTWRGPLIAQLSGSLLDNRSNSYGQGIRRIGGALNLTLPLPADLVLSGRASLQRTLYDDAIFVDETYLNDEDNRNTWVVSLEWPLTPLLSVEAKYSAFTQEFGLASADYFRQLLFLGVGINPR